MAQDLREILKNDKAKPAIPMREGHQSRFEDRLNAEVPTKKKPDTSSNKGVIYLWMKIAAAVIFAGGILWFVGKNAFTEADTNKLVETETVTPVGEQEVLLRNISPDFAQLENRYLASVNLQLSRLEINDGNKELVDAFMAQLAKLDIEYKRLNLEITETGITDEMVTAMIENLELRVELMMKLKAKLKELKAEADHAAAVQTI
jgi:hypothetical protein|tara:strand:+ start:4293 stop:4904 length:612 start_codon:yes stop_codon:yes gene_type:complete